MHIPTENVLIDDTDSKLARLRGLIRTVPDFPKPGIVFIDIMPLLGDPAGLALAVELVSEPFRNMKIDKVVGAESRGFIFGTATARDLSAGFVPIRKPGRLPCDTISESYDLEYGSNQLEIHKDAIKPGETVLVIDDLLATGGTIAACCRLVETLGGQVAGIAFLVELTFLNGRQQITQYPVHSVLKFDE